MGVRAEVLTAVRIVQWVAEDVLGPTQPGAQALSRRLEHMFDSVGWGSDGKRDRECYVDAASTGTVRLCNYPLSEISEPLQIAVI
jgi:hypothetical protein